MTDVPSNQRHDNKVPDLALYRAFTQMAADWIWELDADLCYVFHDGREGPITGGSAEEVIGKNRIELLDKCFVPCAELDKHHRLMLNHEKFELVLPVQQGSELRYVLLIAEPILNEEGVFSGYRGCGRDVTRRMEVEAKLEHLATHDDLTGVINRREFERRLGELQLKVDSDGAEYSLCFIDLDKFKEVNDTGGHHAGDQLLRELVNMMSKHIRPGETVARLGGDEFGLLLLSNTEVATQEAESIIDAVARYIFKWEGAEYRVGASIGVTAVTGTNQSVETLMVRADHACYAAKNNGRNQSHVADEEVQLDTSGANRIAMIRRAMQNNQYKLLMQPIISLTAEESFSRYEVLVRLECDHEELLEPGEFMPLAKKYSLMQELDAWVVENALLALNSLNESGEEVGLSINLSVSTLSDNQALNRITEIFSRYEIPRKRVCLDVTETCAIRNVESVSSFMKTLKSQGVEFALDDFGSGLCSFSYLQHFPLDYLKIDGELIRKLSSDKAVHCITSSLHELSVKLGIKSVAESVEDDGTAAVVKQMGINYMQGFGVADLVELKVPSVLNSKFSIATKL